MTKASKALEIPAPALPWPAVSNTAYKIIAAISFTHLLNDMMQSLLIAIYPIIKQGLHLSLGQIGLITFCVLVTQFAAGPGSR